MPQVLGRYHIIGELGRGGMGVVYKAVDPKLERFIAIKCLSEALSEDELTVTRFLREARNIAALNHPHIAQIFLADEEDGRPYFVMEYVDGESLAERLAREKRLMPEQALKIVTECAEALKAAHEEHIVHRDVKPGNIMLDRRGRTVLTDFGIASIMHPDGKSPNTAPVMGTPGYLPPEVIRGESPDHRGDIFALGAVLFEMLTGRRLVPGRDLRDTARTLLAEEFPELGDLDEQIDEVTCGVLGRMIAPDPDRRFRNYEDLLARLRPGSAVAGTGGASPGVGRASHSAAPVASRGDAPTTREAASTDATAAVTVDVDADAAEPPRTEISPPPAGRHRSSSVPMAAAMVVVLVLMAIAVVRLVPERWEQVTALFEASEVEEGDASASTADSRVPVLPSTRTGAEDERPSPVARTTETAERDADSESSGEVLARTERLMEAPGLETGAPATTYQPPLDEGRAVPAGTGDQAFGQQVSGPDAERAVSLRAEAAPSAPSRPVSSRVPAAVDGQTARSGPGGLVAAHGALVIGQGDPVLVDPMVRSVEAALRAEGHEIVDRGFVRSLASLTAAEQIDLSRLARVATAAGARYAVILRAMPAGQRQLSYFGRTDTLFLVQMETLTYDLVDQRQLGATELQQVDYTVLNATEQARQAIVPRLDAIARQLVADRD